MPLSLSCSIRTLAYAIGTLLMLTCHAVSAQCSILEIAGEQQSNHEFVVSGVLQPDGKPEVIKLTQSVVQADNISLAIDSFTMIVRDKYPDYKLVTYLVSPRSLLVNYAPCEPIL